MSEWNDAIEAAVRAMVPSAYSMAITNVARFIRSRRNLSGDDVPLDGYRASEVLAVAFCKAKEEVLADILSVEL